MSSPLRILLVEDDLSILTGLSINLRFAADYAGRKGITLVLENHWGPTGTAAGTSALATPVDNEPWLGERPAADVPGVDPDRPSGTGYPTTRGETGL